MPTKPMDQKLRIERAISISESGCWEWQLKKDRVGYGRLKVSMGSRESFRHVSAHRYAWELWVGEIPDGMNVLQSGASFSRNSERQHARHACKRAWPQGVQAQSKSPSHRHRNGEQAWMTR